MVAYVWNEDDDTYLDGDIGEIVPCTTNQCTENKGECDENAFCIDTKDSFECKCEYGYNGDGKNCCNDGYIWDNDNGICAEVDECIDQGDICGDNASCTNTEGSYHCSCDQGYKVSIYGTKCVDNESLTKLFSTKKSYITVVPKGHTPDYREFQQAEYFGMPTNHLTVEAVFRYNL